MKQNAVKTSPDFPAAWNHSTHADFYEYYARESQTEQALQRFRGVRDTILRVLGPARALDVVDIGCGAGTQSMIWAEAGHRAHAIDINEPLLSLGRERAAQAGYTIDFQVGSATALPWPDASADVCIALELLEHVAAWQACVSEFVRILLCPLQAEYNLPLYSWYPAPLKRHYEKLASTTRPQLANYATYPAVNWFTYYQLSDYLSARGFRCLDRFDMMDVEGKGLPARSVVGAVRLLPPVRFLGQVLTRGTRVLALKNGGVK